MIFPSRDSILRSSADEPSALPVHRTRYPGKSNVASNRRNPRNDAAKLRDFFLYRKPVEETAIAVRRSRSKLAIKT
jgi:hypothetical protein